MSSLQHASVRPEKVPRYRNLALGLVGVLLLPPFLRPAFPGASMLSAILFLGLVTRTLVTAHVSRMVRLVLTTAMAAVTLRATGAEGFLMGGPWGVELALRALTALAFALVVLAVMRLVLASGPVDADKLYAAVSGYLLIGLAFASMYETLTFWKPDAFRFLGTSSGDRDSFFYFSLVTLSTLGYGDMLPNLPETRVLAVAEAILGQLYLAVLMARLVGLHLNQTGDSVRPPPLSNGARDVPTTESEAS